MDRLVAGDRALRKLTLFHVEGTRTDIAAEVPGLTAEEAHESGAEGGWSRTDAMAILAAREALAHAEVDPSQRPVDLALGGTTAGMFETEELLAELARDPTAMAPLRRMLSHPLSSTPDHVQATVGPFENVRGLCSACSSGANAVLLAAAWLRSGRSSCVLAGGADGLCRLTFTGFGALAALAREACRPFDGRRAGLNLGEGAAFLVLEPAHVARARGAVPVAELRGWAVGAEAHHITNPEPSGHTAAQIMSQALAQAQVSPAELDYVNAHGTATPLNDSMETAALHRCLGGEVERVRVSTCKGQIGHTLGAAGAIEAAVSAMVISRGVMPPTVGLEEVDDACQLRHITKAERGPVRAAMSNSFGFGGTDTVLVFAKPDHFDEIALPRRRDVVVSGVGTVGPLGVLAAEDCASYLEDGPPPSPGPIEFDAKEHLDIGRARRLDRAGRLTTVAVQAALRDAGRLVASEPPGASDPPQAKPEGHLRVGAIVGASFGSVDASTAYMRRIHERGARFASPADFPNLVPSSPVGHASIYLGLRGPVFAMSDLGTTAEAAVVTAAELIEVGEADAIAAGSVEEASPTIEAVLGPVCSGSMKDEVRSEGAAVLLLEDAERLEARGGRPLAELSWWIGWRGTSHAALSEAPGPKSERALVVAPDAGVAAQLLVGTPWADVPVRSVLHRTGSHEGAGGFAMAAAVSLLAAGSASQVLVVGAAPERGFALLLCAPSTGGHASSAAGGRKAQDG